MEVGKFYDPSLLPDFSTETFRLQQDKLVQHDVRDIENELIPAWRMEEELRPGTVVLVSATLHVYNIKTNQAGSFRRVRIPCTLPR